MTYYHQQVLKIKKELYPPDCLIEQVVNAKLFIDTNYANRINIQDIAKKAFYSKFHFIRIFKNCYGRTPHQYLREVRIQQAKRILKKGLPVTDACFSVGFDSVSSFSGLFKKLTGSAPSVFIAAQKQIKNRNFEEVILKISHDFYKKKI